MSFLLNDISIYLIRGVYMNKLYNKLYGAKYLNDIEKNASELKSKYLKMSKFYDNNEEFPFENDGILHETQIKTHFDEDSHTFMIAFECSRPNRVHKKLPVAFDWIINFTALPSKVLSYPIYNNDTKFCTEGYGIHAGYALSFLSIIDILSKKIDECLATNVIKEFNVYGWSYGGAMASLLHLWLKAKYSKKPTITFTIGAPMVWFHPIIHPFEFFRIKRLKSRLEGLYMFQNANDIVPKAPFKILGYRHLTPNIVLEKPFNLIKIFKPTVYHLKTRYDELITNYFDRMLVK